MEKTRYFIQIMFYCAEEGLLEAEPFEEWMIAQKQLLGDLLGHLCAITGFSISEQFSSNQIGNIIYQLFLEARGESIRDYEIVNFIIQRFKIAIRLSSSISSPLCSFKTILN